MKKLYNRFLSSSSMVIFQKSILFVFNSEVCRSKVPWDIEADNVGVGFVRNSCDLVFHLCCIDSTSFVLPSTIFVFSPYHSFARTVVAPPLTTPQMGPPSPDLCFRLCFHWPLVVAPAMPTLRLHCHLDKFQLNQIKLKRLFNCESNINPI